MTIIAPLIPQLVRDITPTIISAICTTDEYAIITFISLCLRQTTPRSPPPSNEKILSILRYLDTSNKNPIRIIPYPPNFSKIPAKIMEPDTGASTWAFGSHWWTKNIGNFTRKAVINIIIITGLLNKKLLKILI